MAGMASGGRRDTMSVGLMTGMVGSGRDWSDVVCSRFFQKMNVMTSSVRIIRAKIRQERTVEAPG